MTIGDGDGTTLGYGMVGVGTAGAGVALDGDGTTHGVGIDLDGAVMDGDGTTPGYGTVGAGVASMALIMVEDFMDMVFIILAELLSIVLEEGIQQVEFPEPLYMLADLI